MAGYHGILYYRDSGGDRPDADLTRMNPNA
jgi:hypothetical protein